MKRALVTGGASPIGRAICAKLAAQGLHVIVHAHASTIEADRVAAAIRAAGGSAETLICDLTDIPTTAAALEPLIGPLAGMSEAQWRGVIDVSLHGFFAALRPLLMPMMATRWGRIVAIASVSALTGNRGQANYAAAKAGLIGAAKSLSREIASRGITVNVVAPGIIASPAVDAAMDAKTIAAMVPMKRPGTADEVAYLVEFLASDRAAYITGQVISINGGMT